MATKTADETRSHHIALMGEPLGTVYDELWQELARVYVTWGEYKVLFGSKPSRVDLLNQASPFFFWLVDNTLWEAVLLHIARLTDNPRVAREDTLTILRLPPLISDPELKVSVGKLVSAALTEVAFCRDWRNRRLAHRNLDLAIQPGANPLAPATREKVDHALQAITRVLNEISSHFKDAETVFAPHLVHDGAESLLYVLHDGISARQSRIERMRQGKANPEEFRTPDL